MIAASRWSGVTPARRIVAHIGVTVKRTGAGRARTHWPFLRDRRVDAYAGLTRRWLG